MRARRIGARPTLVLVLGVLGALGFAGCSSERDFEIQVLHEGRPIRGVRILDVGTEQELGRTGPDGRKLLRVASKPKAPLRVRLEAPPEADSLLFESDYTIDAAAVAQGILAITARAKTSFDSPAQLSITSEPSGAEIWMDGARIGVTPLTLSELEPNRAVTLQARLSGRSSQEVQIFLISGDNNRQSFDLTVPAAETRPHAEVIPDRPPPRERHVEGDPPAPRRTERTEPAAAGPRARHQYSVSTSPGVAEVYVDNGRENLNGAGRFRLTLEEGAHAFRVVHPSSGTETVLRYVVPAVQAHKILILDYQKGEVRSR